MSATTRHNGARFPPDKDAAYMVLRLADMETCQFRLKIGSTLPTAMQAALQKLQASDWVRLLDVILDGENAMSVVRVFRVMPNAMDWFVEESRKRNQ